VKVFPTLAAMLGAAMAMLPIAPPEHVHEAEAEGHVHVVVHRHAKVHDILDRHADITSKSRTTMDRRSR